MANPLKPPRGTTASLGTFILEQGELAVNTDTDRLHLGDGETLGGNPLARLDEVVASDPTLAALAAMDASTGLLEQTGADTFTKRAIGVAASTSIPTRADADARYLASPTLTGDPKAPTPAIGDNDTSIVTSEFVARLWAKLASGFIAPAAGIYYDNNSNYQDFGATFQHVVYTNLTPTTLHFPRFTACVSKGDNSGLKGVGAEYILVRDDVSVDTDAERCALYGIAISMRPKQSRSNSPHDDVAALVLSNDGEGKGTECIYIGPNQNGTPPAKDWVGAIGIQAASDIAIWAVAAFGYGIDFSRGLASPATFTGSAMRVPNNVTALSGRNVANNADVALVGINASDQLVLNGTAVTAAGLALLDDASASAQRTTLGLALGTDIYSKAAIDAGFQPLDSDLTAIAALTTTSFGRSLLAAADAAALRSLAGLVLGTDIYSKSAVDAGFQPLDSDLTAIAALTTTSFGRSLLTVGSAWADWTPTVSSGTGTLTTAGGVAGSCRWTQIGKVVHFTAVITVTTKGTGATSLIFTLPVTALKDTNFAGIRTSSDTILISRVSPSSSNCVVKLNGGADPLVDGGGYLVSGSYEVA